MKERIVWTALPNGLADGHLRLSVFIAPQLDPTPGPARLGTFEHWLDWPRLVSSLRFSASFQSGTGAPMVVAARRDPASSAADAALWRRLFPAETPLAVFRQKRFDRQTIRSYPAANIVSFLEKPYRACATDSPTRRPPVHVLADPETGFGKIVRPAVLRKLAAVDFGAGPGVRSQATRRSGDRTGTGRQRFSRAAGPGGLRAQVELIDSLRKEVARELEPRFAGRKFIPAGPVDPAGDFLQAKLFQLPRTLERLPKRIPVPEMDFHRLVSTLGQHPELLRRTGLVVDLLFPLSGGTPPPQGQVWLSIDAPPEGAANEFPRTEYELDRQLPAGAAFAARPSPDGEMQNRLLRLGGGRFEVVQIDVDGASQKAVQLADNIHRTISPQLRTADSANSVSIPSMRSAGLSVVRSGRAELLHKSFVRARAHREAIKESAPVSLFAEDLTRGHRVDVHDGTSGEWRSLCARTVSYTFTEGGPPITVEGDEGWTATASTESPTTASSSGSDPDVYVQESLFRWAGWSLVTPRPGKHLDENQQAARASHQADSGLPLTATTRATPGTLPKLRFGASYKVRMRAVDLAGNSLSPADADRLPPAIANQTATAPVIYRRHEVITQPVLRLRRALEQSGPGEGLERLVIRSFNKGGAQQDERVAPSELSADENERHVAPPGTAQLTAETHAMFDSGGRPDAAAYAAIVGRDGEFSSDVYPESRLEVPYLPDPLARGAAFIGLPQAGEPDNAVTVFRADGTSQRWSIHPAPKEPLSIVHVEFGRSRWPESEPFRLRSVASQQARDPEWNAGERVLTVFVRPGETVPVRYASFLYREDLSAMAVWRWVVEADRIGQLEGRALAGLHWMLTPYRKLSLVHAVQRPLTTPQFENLGSRRVEGQTSADLSDKIPISGKSTSRLDVEARWSESLDDGSGPRRVERGGHAFDMTVEPTDMTAEFGPTRRVTRMPVRQVMQRKGLAAAAEESGVTPAAVLGLRPQATPRPTRAGQGQRTRVVAQSLGRATRGEHEPSLLTAQRVSPDDAEIAARTRTIGRHEFGDTKHRRVTYTAVASSRFRDDLPFTAEEISRSEAEDGDKRITRASEPVTIDILSSARPAAPAVAYVIPTFGWEAGSAGSEASRTRRGGGLRVYLERPWFSSGEGELLGVVIDPPTGGRLRRSTSGRVAVGAAELESYITQWGMDPLWLTSPPGNSRSPGFGAFRNPATTESDVSLAELPGARVSVAGFAIGGWTEEAGFSGYDERRGLWYCDVEMDPGDSYFPFVRLALARYQPKSLSWSGGDLKLSRVVLADFAQLAPDRAVTISPRSVTELQVSVSGVTARESSEQKFGAGSTSGPAGARGRGVTGLSRDPRPTRSPAAQAPGAAAPRGLGTSRAQPTRSSIVAGPVERIFGTAKTGGNSVEVSLEALADGGSDDLGWSAVPESTVELEPSPSIGSRSVWQGVVSLPEPRGSRRYRLVIKEYEWFMGDRPGAPARGDRVHAVVPRLVYADVVEL